MKTRQSKERCYTANISLNYATIKGIEKHTRNKDISKSRFIDKILQKELKRLDK